MTSSRKMAERANPTLIASSRWPTPKAGESAVAIAAAIEAEAAVQVVVAEDATTAAAVVVAADAGLAVMAAGRAAAAEADNPNM